METENKAIVVNLLSNGPQIDSRQLKPEEQQNCIDIRTEEQKQSLLNRLLSLNIEDKKDETFIRMCGGDGKQEPIWFHVKKECLLKVADNVFFKMNTYSTINKQCQVDYPLAINNKDNSIVIQTITPNTGGYYISYHDSTIKFNENSDNFNRSDTKCIQILPSGDIKYTSKPSLKPKELYQTKNPDHSTFYQQRQSYLTNLRRASGFVENTKGLIGIDIFNGSCLCGTGCCSNDDMFIDGGKAISLKDINDRMKISEGCNPYL